MLTLRFLECKRASLYNDFSVRYSVAKEAGTMNIGEQIKARRIEIAGRPARTIQISRS